MSDTFKSHEVRNLTMELYYSAERLHIIPALGVLPINQVTPVKIQGLLYQLQAEKGLSQRTISLVRGVMYDYAMEIRLSDFNPARNTKLLCQPRKPDNERKVILIARREALLKVADGDEIMRLSSCGLENRWLSSGNALTLPPGLSPSGSL